MAEPGLGSDSARGAARVALSVGLLVCGCGARGALRVDPPSALDAGTGALDAATALDAPRETPDVSAVDPCPSTPVPLGRTEVETIFLLDGSGSMSGTWDGLPAGPAAPSRWEIVRAALAEVLPPYDAELLVGAKVFPDGSDCNVRAGLQVLPGRHHVGELLALFDRWIPTGGTPTTDALSRVLDRPAAAPRVIVATLDGGPNCNADLVPETCVCTGPAAVCLRNPAACLDSTELLAVVRAANEELGIPVVIVGIDDPTQPALSDLLDEVAIAGGWPRPPGRGRRFYDARAPADLEPAFAEIAGRIARCVLVTPAPPPEGATVEVRVGGALVPRDLTHGEGWDWSDRALGALALFGAACDAARAGGLDVRARVTCAE